MDRCVYTYAMLKLPLNPKKDPYHVLYIRLLLGNDPAFRVSLCVSDNVDRKIEFKPKLRRMKTLKNRSNKSKNSVG